MSGFQIKFAYDLKDPDDSSPMARHGPLFHRWLPNGEADALRLGTGHPGYLLKVWFERTGYVGGPLIRFDPKRREVDPEIMATQGILEAGTLRGLLAIDNPPAGALEAVRQKAIGDEAYIRFGKFLIKHILYPALSRLLNLLRINYGQYWLREIERWDSRQASIGHHCSGLDMKWREDGCERWTAFNPGEMWATVSVSAILGDPCREYITQ